MAHGIRLISFLHDHTSTTASRFLVLHFSRKFLRILHLQFIRSKASKGVSSVLDFVLRTERTVWTTNTNHEIVGAALRSRPPRGRIRSEWDRFDDEAR